MVTLAESQLQLSDFQLVQEIYFPKNYEASSMWKLKQLLWETAVVQWEQTAESLGSFGEVWEPLPIGKHFDSILDLGCGYGRLAAYLSKQKKITCNKYYGIDISESLLRRMLGYKRAYNLFPSAEFSLICSAGDKLPFEDNSIDFVRASSIFLSLETEQLKHNLAEIARVIKPGGVFVFEDLFYNRYCPMNILDNVLHKTRKSKLNFGHLKQYSLREIKRLLKNSQLSQKCPQYTIKPHKPALLQEKFGNVGMRVSNDINKEINPPKFLKEFLACGYSVYSKV